MQRVNANRINERKALKCCGVRAPTVRRDHEVVEVSVADAEEVSDDAVAGCGRDG